MAKGFISLAALLTVWVILPGCDGFSSQSLHPSLRPKASNDLGSRFSCPSLAGARLPAPLQRQMAIMENSYSHVSMPQVSMQLDFVDKLGKMGLGFGGPKVRAEEDVKSFCFSKVAVSPSLQGVASEATEAGRSDGKPKENQDKCVVLKDIFDGISMYSVFDGHGSYGGQVAEWLTQQVPSDIKNALYRSDVRMPVAQRIAESFVQVDQELAAAFGDAVIESGATGTVILHKGDKILVSHVGDSRAVLGSTGNKYTVLTVDHSPALPAERARIEASGGEVGVLPGELPIEETGDGRVFVAGLPGPALNTARAFGDVTAKSVGVTASPEQKCISLAPTDKCIIIASDGVWDAMDEETAVETVMQYAKDKDSEMAATVLVQACRLVWEAKPTGSIAIDDISAVVVFF